jgi:hypothetical protein
VNNTASKTARISWIAPHWWKGNDVVPPFNRNIDAGDALRAAVGREEMNETPSDHHNEKRHG